MSASGSLEFGVLADSWLSEYSMFFAFLIIFIEADVCIMSK